MDIRFSIQAELDLEEIGDTIAAASPLAALRFIRDIRHHCDRIATAPLAYPARPELGSGIRCCVHQRYLIFFEPRPSVVLIVRILHGSRDIDAVFSDLSEL
jgi:toxin ParE1/3/4